MTLKLDLLELTILIISLIVVFIYSAMSFKKLMEIIRKATKTNNLLLLTCYNITVFFSRSKNKILKKKNNWEFNKKEILPKYIIKENRMHNLSFILVSLITIIILSLGNVRIMSEIVSQF